MDAARVYLHSVLNSVYGKYRYLLLLLRHRSNDKHKMTTKDGCTNTNTNINTILFTIMPTDHTKCFLSLICFVHFVRL